MTTWINIIVIGDNYTTLESYHEILNAIKRSKTGFIQVNGDYCAQYSAPVLVNITQIVAVELGSDEYRALRHKN